MHYNMLRLLIILINFKDIKANISDKQYASMPELFYQDNYDRCMLLEGGGPYCSITYVLEPINKDHPPEIWNIIKNISNRKTNYRHDHLRHWICVPTFCPEVQKNNISLRKGIENYYNKKFSHLDLQGIVSKIECETAISKYPIDWLDVLSGITLIVYICFVLFGTFYEGVARYKTPEEYKQLTSTPIGKILSAFSLTRNWMRLKKINTSPEINKLRCIQGIRVYNTALVIMSHTILCFIAAPVANSIYPENMHMKYMTIFFSSGPLCVSTFFFISSFLLSNGLFEHMKDKKGLSVRECLLAFSNRLFRLTPTVAVVILLHATWLRHLGNGPNWNNFVLMEYKKCRENWWTNLLYIHNWVDRHNMCLPVTWYLGLDMQYFIMSLLFIWLLKKYEKYIWYIIGAALSLNMIGTFLQNYYYNFPALILPTPEYYYGLENMLSSHSFHYQLGGFIGNTAGQIVGIAFGYYFYQHKNDKLEDRLFTTNFKRIMWWILTFGLALSFVISSGIIFLRDNAKHDAFWASVHVAFSRPIMTFAIGIIVIGFTEGIGWLALRVVQWPPTYVLGRLSLSAYLIHMSVILTRMSRTRYPQYIADPEIIRTFFGDLVTVYMAATFLTLFFELPVTELQKYIFKKEEKLEDKNTNKEQKQM